MPAADAQAQPKWRRRLPPPQPARRRIIDRLAGRGAQPRQQRVAPVLTRLQADVVAPEADRTRRYDGTGLPDSRLSLAVDPLEAQAGGGAEQLGVDRHHAGRWQAEFLALYDR